jgi:hypothetical protein
MAPWPFIAAAYALTLGGTVASFAMSWRRMRRAERALAELERQGR